MRTVLTLVFCIVLASPAVVAAADADIVGATSEFPGLVAADTVRTNLWLVQSMMGEIVREAAAVLPAGPTTVSLRPTTSLGSAIFLAAAHAELTERGHEVYLDESATMDPTLRAAYEPVETDFAIRFEVETLDLNYPEVGRRFGLWRQWVDRELELAVIVSVLDERSGRLLFDRRVSRVFGDRVASEHLSAVESSVYPFTAASVSESGWRSILEEMLVVGVLTGMVAIYFANSGS